MAAYGIPYTEVRRVTGTLLRVHGFGVHSGYPTSSHGHAVAVNACPVSWLEVIYLFTFCLPSSGVSIGSSKATGGVGGGGGGGGRRRKGDGGGGRGCLRRVSFPRSLYC